MWRRSRTARCRPRAAARMRSRPVSSALYRAASGKPRWRSTRCAALSQQRMRRRDECVKHLNPELSTVLAPCHSLRLHSVHLFVSWTLCFPALPPSSRWRDQPFTVMRPSWAAWHPTGAHQPIWRVLTVSGAASAAHAVRDYSYLKSATCVKKRRIWSESRPTLQLTWEHIAATGRVV